MNQKNISTYVSFENNGIISINFNPSPDYWKYPNNNKNDLFASLYEEITKKFVYQPLNDKTKQAIENETSKIINDWISKQEVLIDYY